MDAATDRDHWSRCRHHLRLQFPLPLSLILFGSLRSQWIRNDRVGFWIWDGGRQVFKTTERNGSASNARCCTGYNATRWVCLYGSAGNWCVTTTCTWCGGWSNYSLSLCSGRGGSHVLGDICNARSFQRRWGGGVVTLDCRGYETPSLRGIPLASRYGNVSCTRRKVRIPQIPTDLLILTISNTLNISCDRSHVRVRALGRHIPIYIFNIKKIGIISSASICNSRRGRLLFERPWTDSQKWEVQCRPR